MKKFLFPLIIATLLFSNVNAQTAPTGLSVSNINVNAVKISWQASTAIPSTSTKVEGFEQPFGTQAWNSGGYNWQLEFNDDTRDYYGSAHTGASSWFVRGYLSGLTLNIALNIKGLWLNASGGISSSTFSYTIKGYDLSNNEIYSQTYNDGGGYMSSYKYLTLNWSNVKRIGVTYDSDMGSNSVSIDDLNYVPAENAYPYYLSTSNTAPVANTIPNGITRGTSFNLGSLQPSTTYYLWMRTFDGDTNGSWTASPISFTTLSTLPVTLTSFTAKATNNYAELQWITASENNNKEFIISRSTDGLNFNEIHRVLASNINNGIKNYSYKDVNPLNGINYYKLSQEDFDGTIKELGIKVLNFQLTNLENQPYPNPTKGKTTIDLIKSTYKFAVLSNSNGKELKRLLIANNDENLSFDLTNYPNGIYIITLIGNSENKTFKVIKE